MGSVILEMKTTCKKAIYPIYKKTVYNLLVIELQQLQNSPCSVVLVFHSCKKLEDSLDDIGSRDQSSTRSRDTTASLTITTTQI